MKTKELFALEKSFEYFLRSWGHASIPPPLWHPRVAIVPYYLYAIKEIFPIQVMPRHRNAPPPPMGAGLAQGGQSSFEKRISTERQSELFAFLKGAIRVNPWRSSSFFSFLKNDWPPELSDRREDVAPLAGWAGPICEKIFTGGLPPPFFRTATILLCSLPEPDGACRRCLLLDNDRRAIRKQLGHDPANLRGVKLHAHDRIGPESLCMFFQPVERLLP